MASAGPAQLAPGLSRKVKKEKRGLATNADFLAAAEGAQAALAAIDAQLSGLVGACGAISDALRASQVATADVVAETAALAKELESTTAKESMISSFLAGYQLTPAEVTSLREGDVGPAFFAALERVGVVHANCRALLRTHHQRAGLELMESMAMYQEAAYERLCRWVQAQCRALGESDAPDIPPTLARATAALRGRALLLRYCQEELAAARTGALFRRFVSALTRGGPGGTPRPMEVHAADPRRYVGDMLAWVHVALAGERDLVTTLFGEGGGDGEGAGDTAALLDRILDGVVRPLTTRVDTVVVTASARGGPLLLFQLANLLEFYALTAAGLLGPSSALVTALTGCASRAGAALLTQMRAAGAALTRQPLVAPTDLSAPVEVTAAASRALELCVAHAAQLQLPRARAAAPGGEESLPVAEGVGPTAPLGIDTALGEIIDPVVTACRAAAEVVSAKAAAVAGGGVKAAGSGGMDGARARGRVFLLNCLGALSAALEPYPAASARVASLAALADAQLTGLVGDECMAVLDRCGLREPLARSRIYLERAVAEADPAQAQSLLQSMASDPQLSPAAAGEGAKALFALYASGSAAPSAVLQRLAAPRVRAMAAGRIAAAIAESYGALFDALSDPAHGYDRPRSVAALKHSPAQIRTLLGL